MRLCGGGSGASPSATSRRPSSGAVRSSSSRVLSLGRRSAVFFMAAAALQAGGALPVSRGQSAVRQRGAGYAHRPGGTGVDQGIANWRQGGARASNPCCA